MEELKYLNALNCIKLLGPARLELLINRYGTAKRAWGADWTGIPELKNIVPRLLKEREGITPDKEWRRLKELGFDVLHLNSPHYPPLLKTITRPPPLLYTCGRWVEEDHLAIAIVGSRRCTFYGREVASRLARELASLGFTIVSGLALGIDTEAHKGALEVSGRSIAVLGCGLNISYPYRNRHLRDQIASSGVVLTEFPPDTTPLPHHFPQRNRIISGLSLGTIVVEAPQKSGALITANYALDQNRGVFAVPGNIGSPYSRGCHRLIKEGARLVESITDILDELAVGPVGGEIAAGKTEVDLLPEERHLLRKIPYHPIHIDEIIRSSSRPASDIWPVLLSLELKGCLCQLPGKLFMRV